MSITMKKARERARDALQKMGVGSRSLTLSAEPWAPPGKPSATLRSHSGKPVAEFYDADDAQAVLDLLRLCAELSEEP